MSTITYYCNKIEKNRLKGLESQQAVADNCYSQWELLTFGVKLAEK